MDIRKISIGADYKSSAMHYIVGQEVLGGTYTIHLIQQDKDTSSFKICIEKQTSGTTEVLLWKEFKPTMPVSLEYNINF